MRTVLATVCLLLAALTCAYAQGPQRPGKSKPPVDLKGKEWEGGETNTSEPHSPNSEFRVGCVLWDLWDANHDGPDTVSMKFSDLFAVYSPSGATLANGPAINGLGEYLARLKANHPKAAGPIDQVRDFNLTKP